MTMATKAMGRSACSRCFASPALANGDDLEGLLFLLLALLLLPNDDPEAFVELDRLVKGPCIVYVHACRKITSPHMENKKRKICKITR